jgi:hypothetical protein
MPGSPTRAEPTVVFRMAGNLSALDRRSNTNSKATYLMQNLSPRHVKIEESLRLGVVSGWYSTKVSGTFVSGPHDSEADCLRKIAEINSPRANDGKVAPATSWPDAAA